MHEPRQDTEQVQHRRQPLHRLPGLVLLHLLRPDTAGQGGQGEGTAGAGGIPEAPGDDVYAASVATRGGCGEGEAKEQQEG